jgi:hypothetical protein
MRALFTPSTSSHFNTSECMFVAVTATTIISNDSGTIQGLATANALKGRARNASTLSMR